MTGNIPALAPLSGRMKSATLRQFVDRGLNALGAHRSFPRGFFANDKPQEIA
jgi:hypothetical protein